MRAAVDPRTRRPHKTWSRYWNGQGVVSGPHYVIDAWHKDGRFERRTGLTERQMAAIERQYLHNGYVK